MSKKCEQQSDFHKALYGVIESLHKSEYRVREERHERLLPPSAPLLF